MDVHELTETMHATSVPVPLDLDRVTRDGRRLRTRRRAVLAAGLAAAVAAVAVPVGLALQPDAAVEPGYAGSPAPREETAQRQEVEQQFRDTAPQADPIGAVLMPGGRYAHKFYLRTGPGSSSLGGLSLWAEQDGLAFGPKDIDGDGAVRRAGSLDLATLAGPGETLSRIPWQNPSEPTFVGLVDVPDGTRASDLQVFTNSSDTTVGTGVRLDVVPGLALVWVNASDGSAPGIELTDWSVRLADGPVLATGGFEGWTKGAWAPGGLD